MSGAQTATPRAQALNATTTPFDLIVIGGGCNGAGIAWDGALRGLRVLLLEKEDFGWATSAWNSRLIHGGLKYLEKYDVRLVRESLREREWLLRAAPHLVRPRQFVLPFYDRNVHSATALRAGMLAYDALSLDKSTPRHRIHRRAQVLDIIPGLNTDGLQGAATYYDGQADYVERISLEAAVAARQAGAVVLNHARVDRLLIDAERVSGVEFTDTDTSCSLTARAQVVVNAAGPWVDEVLAGGLRNAAPLMGGTKGTHLIVDPFPGAPMDSAMYYEAITDARPMMVIPWLGRYIIGATDERFVGDLDTASADDGEIDYILRETNLVLSEAGLTREHIVWSYTGVRPLPHHPDGPTSDITRRHVLHDHSTVATHRVHGLYSVVGGKLTTFRSLAEDVNDRVVRDLGAKHRPCTTKASRLPGGRTVQYAAFAEGFAQGARVAPATVQRLLRLYGTRAVEVDTLVAQDPALGRQIPDANGAIEAEVVFAIREELALTLTDIVARRLMTGIGGDLGLGSLDSVAEVAARHLGWDPDRVEEEKKRYRQYITKFEQDREVSL